MKTLLRLLTICSLLGAGAYLPARVCSQPEETTRVARCSFRCTVAKTTVIIDSQRVGVTPLDSIMVMAGLHVLHYIHPSGNSWFYPAQEETLLLKSGEWYRKEIIFPTLWHITTEPYGATVITGDSVAGRTPMCFRGTPVPQVVRISRDGFEDELVPLSAEGGDLHLVLRPKSGETPAGNSSYLADQHDWHSTPLYISAGTTVFAGALAACLKIRADASYDDYKQTGDQGTLDHVRALDRYSGIALILSQVGLAALTYQLLNR